MSSIMRLVRGLGSLIVLVALVAGVPLALVRVIGPPWPSHQPTLASVAGWFDQLDRGDARSVVIGVLTVIVWVAWARLAIAVAVSATVLVIRRGRPHIPVPRVPGLGSAQPLALGLLAGVGLLAGLVPIRAGAPAAADKPPLPAPPIEAALARGSLATAGAWWTTPFLAAAVVGAVTATRRRRLRSATSGEVLAELPIALARLERDLRSAARPAIDDGDRPALVVHVGRSEEGEVHLDLASVAPLSVDGPDAVARSVVRALTTEAELRGAGSVPVGMNLPRAGARLTQTDDGWRLSPGDTVLEPVRLERDALAEVRALLAAVDRPAVAAGPPAVADQVGTAPWSFVVRVLGPVDVVGAEGRTVTFERAKSLELVTWLSLHRRRSTRDAARCALWEHDVRDTTFANVVSEARRAMNRHQAVAAAGEWLGRANGDHLPLHPEVVSDVDLFETHLAAARRAGDAATAATELRAALGLVRGVPFAGSGYAWADAESLSSTITLLVVSAAADLAENCRRLGDGPGALWATAVGLGVLPGHEQLVALRLQAHADAGDLAGVRHEWAAYERALAADRWHAEPSPRLVQLCRELLGSALAGR